MARSHRVARLVVGASLAVIVATLVAWNSTAPVSAQWLRRPHTFHSATHERGDESCYENQFRYNGLSGGDSEADGSGHATFKTSKRFGEEAGAGTITWGFDAGIQGPNELDGTPTDTSTDIDALVNVIIVWNDGATITYVSRCALEVQTETNLESPTRQGYPNGNGIAEVETEGRAAITIGWYHWEGNAVASIVQEDGGELLEDLPQGHLSLQIERGKACREGAEIVGISVDLGEADEAGGTSNNLEVDNKTTGRAAFPLGKDPIVTDPTDPMFCTGFN